MEETFEAPPLKHRIQGKLEKLYNLKVKHILYLV